MSKAVTQALPALTCSRSGGRRSAGLRSVLFALGSIVLVAGWLIQPTSRALAGGGGGGSCSGFGTGGAGGGGGAGATGGDGSATGSSAGGAGGTSAGASGGNGNFILSGSLTPR